MGTMRLIDPPQRAAWVERLSPHQKATALLREYLTSRVGCVDQKESSACRRMLGSLGRIQADGNVAGVELNVVNARSGSVLLYFHIPGLGPIEWLPQMVTGINIRLQHIMRETKPGERMPLEAPVMVARDVLDDGPGRRIPPKTETRLIPGKRAF